MHQVEDNPSSYVRVPARVFGYLRGGEITVFLLTGHGLGRVFKLRIQIPIPLNPP